MNTSAFDLTRQARWEVEGTRRAAQRYLEAAAVADPTTLPSGQRLLREVVPPLTVAIQQAQRDALARAGQKGRPAAWDGPVQLLDAQTLALITVATALRCGETNEQGTGTILSVARELAARARDELDFRTWIATQVAENKVARAAGDREHRDLLKAFRATYPNADTKAWRRWSRRMELCRTTPWDQRVAAHFGAAALHWLLETAPHYFTKANQPIPGGKTQAWLVLTPRAKEVIEDIEQRASLARPRLMPMLIPPVRWEYPAQEGPCI